MRAKSKHIQIGLLFLSILGASACDIKPSRDSDSSSDEDNFGNVAVLDINVEDSNFAACITAGAVINGWLRAVEVENLNCDGFEITSVNGIAQLSSLQTLSLQNNLLRELDLSSNTLLRELNFNDNFVTEIDLSELNFLETLIVGENFLESLNVSALSVLKELSFGGNPSLNALNFGSLSGIESISASNLPSLSIASLALSQHTNLESLDLSDNNLESIDISANTVLTTINLSNNNLEFDDLGFLSTPGFLESIDLSSNRILSDSTNTVTLAAGNFIESLNLADNTIQELDLTECPLMTNLTLSDNLIASLDFSTCSNLKEIEVDANLLSGELLITNNTNLERIVANDNNIVEFGDYRSTHSNLEFLDLSDNNLESTMDGPTRSNLILLQAEGVTVLF